MPHSDYCNIALYGLPTNLIQCLQSVQNAAAPLTFSIQCSEHITPALITLYWLRVPKRISFKLSVLTYQAIHGIGPRYLQADFTPVADKEVKTRFLTQSVWNWLTGLPLNNLSCRHAIKTTTAPILFWSPARAAHPSLYSRQSHISSFWRCSMERSAGPCHICAVACDFQTAPPDIPVLLLWSWHCHLTHKLPVFYTCVDLAIIALFRPR